MPWLQVLFDPFNYRHFFPRSRICKQKKRLFNEQDRKLWENIRATKNSHVKRKIAWVRFVWLQSSQWSFWCCVSCLPPDSPPTTQNGFVETENCILLFFFVKISQVVFSDVRPYFVCRPEIQQFALKHHFDRFLINIEKENKQSQETHPYEDMICHRNHLHVQNFHLNDVLE